MGGQPEPRGAGHSREFRPVTYNPDDENHQDANRAHVTASKNRHHGLKTIAEASKASIRKSFVDKAYGINDRDRWWLFGR